MQDMKLTIEPEFAARVPGYRAIIIEACVANSPPPQLQKQELDALAASIASRYEVADINTLPAIAATRRANKACG